MLKPLKDYKLKTKKNSRYISIFDMDAINAARSYTKRDSRSTYTYLKEVFEDIRNDNNFREPMYNTIMQSQESFVWFTVLLRELENLLKVMEPFPIPYEKAPENSEDTIEFYQPYIPIMCKAKERVYLYQSSILDKKKHPIENYRLLYLLENYDMSEFYNDIYPHWYLLQDTVVFEQYNERTNVRVRIDFKNGDFNYYIAGASDNWQLLNFPLEVDHFITALLFREP